MEYYVKFIGYSAFIVTKRETQHAVIDFVSECTFIDADQATLIVRNRGDLARIVADFASDHLLTKDEDPAKHHTTDSTDNEISWKKGDNEICFSLDSDPKKVIRRLERRVRQLEPVLQQAEIMGSRIERRPYSEFVDEIEATGLVRVVFHGYGTFES